MAQGNTKANKWNCVINAKKEAAKSEIKSQLELLLSDIINNTTYKNYFAIIHDKDYTETGEPKRTHLHLVIEYAEKKTFSAVLSDLTRFNGVEDKQISIEPANSPILAEQYLIHKNDTSKAQYDKSQVITNNIEELTNRLEAKYLTPQEQEAERQEALRTARTFTEFIDRAGLEFANRYRGIFKDLREERETNTPKREELYRKARELLLNIYRTLKVKKDTETIETIIEEIEYFLENFYDK